MTRLGFSIALAVGLLSLTGYLLLILRQEAWRGAEMRSANLVQLIGQDIDRNIEVFDLSLQAVLDGLRMPEVDSLSPPLRRMVLFDRAASADDLGPIKVVDRNGDVVLNSFVEKPAAENVTEQEFFQVHRSDPSVTLHVSLPLVAPGEGTPVIAFSRRISAADGAFDGVVFGTLRLAYLQSLFGKLDVGSTGSINLFRSDGRLLMRSPYRWSDIGRDISETATFKAFSAMPSGTYVGSASFDNIQRFYTFSHLPHGPVLLNVALGIHEILAGWWMRVLWTGGPVLLLAGLTVFSTVQSEIHLARRAIAEQRLGEINKQLADLAQTDGLTGLGNRRSFDEALSRELRRAVRTGAALSVLLIDADHFKSFNDEFGHSVGDAVLRGIAGELRAELKRACDQACRVGGEEFGLILPDIDLQGAASHAETIRRRVARARLEGVDNVRPVTVSIGVCHVRPTADTTPAQVYARADEALYEAKRRGRSRSVLFEFGRQPLEQAVAS